MLIIELQALEIAFTMKIIIIDQICLLSQPYESIIQIYIFQKVFPSNNIKKKIKHINSIIII
jgi:hypothetical protein